MFHRLTWQFRDSEIARELGLDLFPKSWDPNYEENKSMCDEMIYECREIEELNKASAGLSIR